LLAQGDLTNGGNHDGSITLDDQDIWAFSANEGDKIFVRAAQLSGGKSFAPRLRIYNEDGAQVGFSTGGASSNNSEGSVDYVASSSGDFTVAIDSGLADGTGTYRLYFLNIAESFIIPGGDHGGELTSGVNRDGSISVGDLDIWTFQASTADRVTMNARQLSGGNAFSPKVRIYDVGGNLVGYSFNSESSTTSETEVVFITSGEVEFIVIVESGLPEGAGTFRLLYTLEAGPFSYPVTNGSTLTNGEIHEGSISVPLEVDTWTFPSAAGDNIAVRLGETDNGTGLHPILQLFSPDGSLLASDSCTSRRIGYGHRRNGGRLLCGNNRRRLGQ